MFVLVLHLLLFLLASKHDKKNIKAYILPWRIGLLVLFVPKKHDATTSTDWEKKHKAFAFYFIQTIPQKQILLLSHSFKWQIE